MLRKRFAACLMLAVLMANALAVDVKVFGTGERIDPSEVARILDQTTPQTVPMKMRSIRLLDDAPVASVVQPSALALTLQFAFDSADIEPSARPQLDAIARGIRLLPAMQTVVIEGHTDARGSNSYNVQLSTRRALSVFAYLVAKHSIDPARLRAVGLGEYAPLNGLDPYEAQNRRVQFRGK